MSSVLTVYKCPYPKSRVGSKADGGYVIVLLPEPNYDFFLSCGIGKNIDFEREFLDLYPDLHGVGYDGTIHSLPKNAPPENRFIFKRKNVLPSSNITEGYKNIFLKMDIEEAEFPYLRSLEDFSIFKQIVIEFHRLDRGGTTKRRLEMLSRLNETHVLVHFHANNCCGLTSIKDPEKIQIPLVFECTYIRRDTVEGLELELNTEKIPSPLDHKNVKSRPEININWKPFVH